MAMVENLVFRKIEWTRYGLYHICQECSLIRNRPLKCPPQKAFFFYKNPQLHTFLLNCLALKNSPPPRNFQSLLWGLWIFSVTTQIMPQIWIWWGDPDKGLSAIWNHLDHGALKEEVNPFPEGNYRFFFLMYRDLSNLRSLILMC